MTLTQISYLITIAETGSLSQAAKRLYVSQPSLTNAVRELEEELGIELFYRSGRGVTLTNDGAEFLLYARQIYSQYEAVMEKYGKGGRKKKFAVSSQHYSFAVRAFVEMIKTIGTASYDFSIRETMTKTVIQDVSTLRSEIGVLYLSDFNRKTLQKLFETSGVEFHHLIDCQAYVYLWKGHPLADRPSIGFEELAPYPCLSFEQGDNSSFYFAEEILSDREYPCMIHAADRATMLNLMVGLNGYTLCSGIICEELNGEDYRAVPFADDENNQNCRMEIGYLMKENMIPSPIARRYLDELEKYLMGYSQKL